MQLQAHTAYIEPVSPYIFNVNNYTEVGNGVLPGDIRSAFDSLSNITGFRYSLNVPADKKQDTVEEFFIEQLNDDILLSIFHIKY